MVTAQAMAVQLTNGSLTINQSKSTQALTPLTYGNKLKTGLRRILRQLQWKMTEGGKTRNVCYNMKLIEHNSFAVRHPATQQETPWATSQGDTGEEEKKASAPLHS